MTAGPVGSTTWAFKEWAVICRALATGRQDVILRKGGVVEPGGVFRLQSREFLLLPTFLHQSADGVAPAAADLLEGIDADRPPAGMVELRHRCQVSEAFAVTAEADLATLRPRHIWSDAVVAERFQRWRQRLDVLVVEVTPLPAPILLPWRDSYGGCKSWVDLGGQPAGVGKA